MDKKIGIEIKEVPKNKIKNYKELKEALTEKVIEATVQKPSEEQTQKIADAIMESINKRVNIPNSDKVIYARLKDCECEYKNGKYCGVDMKKGVLTENDCLYCEGRRVNGIPYYLAINEMATAMCKEDNERSGNGCVGCPYAPYRSEECRNAVEFIVEYGKYTDLAVVATKVLLGVSK